jgi:hypothetical protein
LVKNTSSLRQTTPFYTRRGLKERSRGMKSLIGTVRQYKRDGLTVERMIKDLCEWVPEEAVRASWAEYEQLPLQIRKLDMSSTLRDPRLEYTLWYDGPQPDDWYWPALKQALIQEGWQPEAIEQLDRSSTKIVSFLEAPGSKTIKTRGLVVGYVQSGKTANYSAVIAKAADAGYRLFIVLSGLTDQLRNQTQRRLVQEIAELNDHNKKTWYTLTDSDADFVTPAGNASTLLSNLDLRLLAIVKKNAAILRRLRNWLRNGLKEVRNSCPVLIIDDEADQASVNASSSKEKRTTINQLILEILEAMPKTAYVGYTATPFANVFIDLADNNLYPTDFIIDLPCPPDYFGAERIFGRDPLMVDEGNQQFDGLDVINIIPDEEVPDLKPAGPKERGDFQPAITTELENALHYFWMATAARQVRDGQKDHSTMLIHTTLYTDVQDRFRPLLSRYRDHFRVRLRDKDQGLIDRLHAQWEEGQQAVPSSDLNLRPVSFEALLPALQNVVADTEIVIENSRSLLRLEYGNEVPKSVIVVGGNILSRGLTLEGLIVSFFIRTANAYDTLLQMGRWFGYRQGYEDLPRIWMTRELQGFFHDMATVEQEIREDIKLYELEGVTPREFALRVRSHPSLEITSRLKMQTATPCSVSFAASFHQTILFRHTDRDWLTDNLEAGRALIRNMKQSGMIPVPGIREQNILFRDVPVQTIRSFLQRYHFHELNKAFSTDLIIEYIDAQNRLGALLSWNVVIVTRKQALKDGPEKLIDLGLDNPLPLLNRSRLQTDGATDYANLGVIANGYGDIVADLGLPDEEVRKTSAPALRAMRPAGIGLLLLYPIDKDSQPRQTEKKSGRNIRVALEAAEHLLGVAFAFPPTPADQTTPQSYLTNSSVAPCEEEKLLDEGES